MTNALQQVVLASDVTNW